MTDLDEFYRWCLHTGNYPAKETVERWARMCPLDKANLRKKWAESREKEKR